MIHVQTGNALDVCCEYRGLKLVIKGLMRHGSSEMIPLPDPKGLAEVIERILEEGK